VPASGSVVADMLRVIVWVAIIVTAAILALRHLA
jgi:hypothetical protein